MGNCILLMAIFIAILTTTIQQIQTSTDYYIILLTTNFMSLFPYFLINQKDFKLI